MTQARKWGWPILQCSEPTRNFWVWDKCVWSCDDVVVLTASKFCEKYYGQDSPGASHLAMTNLSKLCAALSALTGPTTVSHRHDVLYHGGLLLIGTVSGSLTVFSIAHSQTSSSVRRSLCYVNSRT